MNNPHICAAIKTVLLVLVSVGVCALAVYIPETFVVMVLMCAVVYCFYRACLESCKKD
jgi:hypothetical protein